jgi:hypothetical protein
MKLNEIKEILSSLETVVFQLPNKSFVPNHFHVTEVGMITKNFIDCGGKVREEKVINFQLWEAGDYDHRLAPSKLVNIIELSEKVLKINPELEIEVEYQSDTIGKYGLEFSNSIFHLITKTTACLATDSCGIPVEKLKKNLLELGTINATCTPGGGCC